MSKRFPPEELLRFQAAGSKQSPFYTGVLDALADESARGNALVIGMLEQTPCTVEAACPLRLLGGAHRCVLDGIAPELATAWPNDNSPGDVRPARSPRCSRCLPRRLRRCLLRCNTTRKRTRSVVRLPSARGSPKSLARPHCPYGCSRSVRAAGS